MRMRIIRRADDGERKDLKALGLDVCLGEFEKGNEKSIRKYLNGLTLSSDYCLFVHAGNNAPMDQTKYPTWESFFYELRFEFSTTYISFDGHLKEIFRLSKERNVQIKDLLMQLILWQKIDFATTKEEIDAIMSKPILYKKEIRFYGLYYSLSRLSKKMSGKNKFRFYDFEYLKELPIFVEYYREICATYNLNKDDGIDRFKISELNRINTL